MHQRQSSSLYRKLLSVTSPTANEDYIRSSSRSYLLIRNAQSFSAFCSPSVFFILGILAMNIFCFFLCGLMKYSSFHPPICTRTWLPQCSTSTKVYPSDAQIPQIGLKSFIFRNMSQGTAIRKLIFMIQSNLTNSKS